MAIDDRTDTHPHVPEEHYCEHPNCDKWGGFGFAASRGTPVRWWCWEHYPHKDPGKPISNGSLPR